MPRLPFVEREWAMGMLQTRGLNVSHRIILRLRHRLQETGINGDLPPNGRPPVTKRHRSSIFAWCTAGSARHKCCRTHTGGSNNVRISSGTMCNCLTRFTMHANARIEAPGILNRQWYVARLQWMTDRLVWRARIWRVILTDGSRLRFSNGDGQVGVWGHRGDFIPMPAFLNKAEKGWGVLWSRMRWVRYTVGAGLASMPNVTWTRWSKLRMYPMPKVKGWHFNRSTPVHILPATHRTSLEQMQSVHTVAQLWLAILGLALLTLS